MDKIMFESHAEIVRLSMAGTWICLALVALLTNLAYRNKKVLLALLTSVLIGAVLIQLDWDILHRALGLGFDCNSCLECLMGTPCKA